MEPKKIIYVDHVGDCWLVWLNTNDDLHLGNSFENYKDAKAFAQAWADGIEVKEDVKCSVITNTATLENPSEPSLETEITDSEAIAKAQDFVTAFIPILQSFSKEMPKFIDDAIVLKRLYLGSTYAYNLLMRCRFLIKSPKIVSIVSSITIYIFMHLPRKLILWWPLPELRD